MKQVFHGIRQRGRTGCGKLTIFFATLVAVASFTSPCWSASVPLGINGAAQFVNMANDGGFYAVGSGTYSEDSNGWPSSDFACNVFDERRNMPWSGPDPSGTNWDISGDYKVSFNGEAVIVDNSGYGTTFTVQNQNYNSGTNTTTCDVIINPDKAFVAVEFTNSQRTSTSATNTGITNLRFIRPGYNANTTQTYTNECLNSYGPGFTTIRTMGLSDTNNYPIWQGTNLFTVNWSDRVKVGDAYQAGTLAENVAGHAGLGIAWEYLVQLSNQVHANIWVNIPINATDAYATNLANLLKYGSNGVTPYTSTQSSPVWAPLNSNLHVYLEYSNEVWNFSFTQAVYNQNKANADGISYADEYAKRSYQLVQDFQTVYGTTNTTLRPVLCWQEGSESGFQPTLDWLASTYGITVSNLFYGVGEAPYYNYTDGSTVNSILATDWTGGDSNRPTFEQWEAIALAYGLKQVGYESGPSYGTGVGMIAFRNAATAAQIQEYYDSNFFAVGGDQVNFWDGGFGGAAPCGGTWTQGEDWNNQASPKELGMIGALASSAPALNGGALLPWLTTQTTTIDPSDTNSSAPTGATSENWGVGGGASEFYLLRAAGSGKYNVWLNGSCNQSGGSTIEVLVDGSDLGNFAITETDANGPTFVTGTLAAGLHSLRLIGGPAGNDFLDSINFTLNSGGGTSSAPTAPDWPTVKSQASGSVTLYWFSSALATSYNVQRSTNYNGPYTTIATPTAVAQPSYTDSAATNNTTFYYVIQAVNSVGASPVSQTISATAASVAPGVPGGLSVSSNATGSNICGNGGGIVTLSWTPVTGATSYNVQAGTSTSSYSTVASGSATIFFQSALTAGQIYYYEVQAVNVNGASAWSSAVSTTPTGAIPAAPTGLTATATQLGVALAWTPPANMDPQFSPDQYFVYRSTTSGSGYTEIYSTSVDNTVDRTAISDGVTYYYVVTANNATGDSSYSGQASGTPTSGGTIDIDAGGSAVSPWAADVNYSGGTTNSTSSSIDTSLISDPAPTQVYQSSRTAPSGSNLVYSIKGLVDNAPYKVRLHFAEIVSGTTQGQRVFNVLVNGAQVLSNYDVVGRTGTVDRAVVEKLDTVASSTGTLTITFVSVTGLAMVNGIEVGYTGSGAQSGLFAPGSLTATPGNTQVALAWSASSGATSYSVYRGTTSGGESATAIVTGVTTTGYTNTGLTNGTTYYYKVTAVNSSSTSGYSNEASATPAAAPTAPTGLTATGGNAQAALTWTASSGATSYNVLRSTVSGSGYAQVTNVTTTSYTNTGLTNGTTYYFVVAAVNTGGTSANSSQVSAIPASSGETALNRTGWVASASSNLSGNTPAMALDGNTTTWWDSGLSQASGQWFELDMQSAQTFNQIILGLPAAPYNYMYPCNYEVNVSSDGVNWGAAVATGTQSTPEPTVIPFAAQTDRYIKIQLTAAGYPGNSWIINEINVYTSGGTAPSAPTGLSATAGNTSNSLSWTASSGATSYNVYRGTAAGGEASTPVATGVTTTSDTDTGLTNGQTYYYKVAAVNTNGTSGYSNETNAMPNGNTHSGTWALQVVSVNPATWDSMNQIQNCSTNTVYTGSFWMKGTGGIVLRLDESNWTLLVGNTFTATSTWTQYSVSTNSGANTSLMYLFMDGSGIAGTSYVDDCFLGTGSTNILGNPGFESGNTVWWEESPFTIVQNP